MANVPRFMKYLGIGAAASKARAEDDDEEKKDPDAAAEDEDEEETARAEDGDDEKKNTDDEARAEDGGDDEEERKREDNAKAKSAAARARADERKRCGAIFALGLKHGVPELAGQLACDSSMSVAEAQSAILTAKQFGGRRGADAIGAELEAARVPNPGSGGGGAPANDRQAVAAKMCALYDAHTGGKRA